MNKKKIVVLMKVFAELSFVAKTIADMREFPLGTEEDDQLLDSFVASSRNAANAIQDEIGFNAGLAQEYGYRGIPPLICLRYHQEEIKGAKGVLAS